MREKPRHWTLEMHTIHSYFYLLNWLLLFTDTHRILFYLQSLKECRSNKYLLQLHSDLQFGKVKPATLISDPDN